MSDVAKEAGCSQSTVSVVLNDIRSVQLSMETRRRVIEVAKRLRYNETQLRTLNIGFGRTAFDKVAFVIDALTTRAEGMHAIDGIRESLKPSKSLLLIAETGNHSELEPAMLQSFLDDGAKAIIYACIFTRKIKVPEVLKNSNTPVILLNCYSDESALPSVVPSEIAGGHRATQALIGAGHTRIGTVVGEEFMEASRDRLTGYRRALASADIAFDPVLVVKGDWSASAGYRGTSTLMQLDDPPTAIFCQSDEMAIGCYEFLKESGYSIPDDVSVIGFDDDNIAQHLSPPLTTLELPLRAMGSWAVEQLMYKENITDEQHALPVKIECTLVQRHSISAPKTVHSRSPQT